jgi:hypothetical protein
LLADLTPHGLEMVDLRVGDRVAIEGELKPSEIKVSKLERDGETSEISHGPHDNHKHPPADPALAIESAKSAGRASPCSPNEPRARCRAGEIVAARSYFCYDSRAPRALASKKG